MNEFDSLVSVALDMTAALSAEQRHQRLLSALRRVIPFDAAALFRLEGGMLVLTAAAGLTADAMGRRLRLKEHPRLDIICKADRPVRFPSDTRLPDPFDGLLADPAHDGRRIHSCLGCPLRVGADLIGALTADAVDPHAFDNLDLRFIEAGASLAAAQTQMIDLVAALEHRAEKMGLIAQDLMDAARAGDAGELIGSSPALQHLRREIDLVAPSDFAVLVTGETGAGKELVVRAIHAASERRRQPVLYINCAAIPEGLAESELFGHVRGAFSGAVADRAGKFELADGGTLFLDEIGELPLNIQPKLLRALQHGEVQRVGSDRPRVADVRLLAATNRDLSREVQAGRFRADLFHRLNVYPLRVPPLRERPGDIPLLAGFFCEQLQRRLGLGPVRLEPDALSLLSAYDWPGNVRELENVLSRAVLKAAAGSERGGQVTIRPRNIDLGRLPEAGAGDGRLTTPSAAGLTQSLTGAVDDFKRRLILETVQANEGNWAAAARQLGLDRGNLSKMAARLGLRKAHLP